MSDATVVLATTNRHKAGEMRAVLVPLLPASFTICSLSDIARSVSDVEETGSTFEENALLKAKFYAKETGCLCVADDSGLCVDVLSGAPGIYSHRWAGAQATDLDRIQKLLGELAGAGAVSPADRGARFVCAAAAAAPGGWTALADGFCAGIIADEPSGAGGFGYDPVFYLPDLKATMAELSPQEKNRQSHRARALIALAPHLSGYLAS
ncbi:MAG TPA: RdgB/HAM1 family non-canonical purine NTP pyrophosphatase [Capsulimonadaceae bacterium]|nr:RdgB/HAM1 family non-canonical purine NTP pyrophosphatase [Capsulimonadaceae bacterium]